MRGPFNVLPGTEEHVGVVPEAASTGRGPFNVFPGTEAEEGELHGEVNEQAAGKEDAIC